MAVVWGIDITNLPEEIRRAINELAGADKAEQARALLESWAQSQPPKLVAGVGPTATEVMARQNAAVNEFHKARQRMMADVHSTGFVAPVKPQRAPKVKPPFPGPVGNPWGNGPSPLASSTMISSIHGRYYMPHIKNDFFQTNGINPIILLAQRLRISVFETRHSASGKDPETVPKFGDLEHLDIYMNEETVFISYVKDGKPATLEDDAKQFPSDELCASMRLLMR